ncbi:MAG: DNA polymerase III subunit delta [Anaerolineaceae bacterium]|nr:DNA polymerase III subunit delta [Anaerolineaceae bacterium]
MAENSPIVTILRGDDSTHIEALLSQYKAELGAPDMAGLNTTVLDGNQASLDDMRSATLSMPFLTPRRLVILTDATSKLDGKKNNDQPKFLALLDSLPQTTSFVLVVEDKLLTRGGKSFWEKLSAKHWLIAWANAAGEKAQIVDCLLPNQREMEGWVKRKTTELGGDFDAGASAKLAEYVGNDTQRALQEITKLMTYVNFERAVSTDDVVLLTAQNQEGNIFDLVDAIGERNGHKALEQMQILLETSDPLEISGMITRQFRLLLGAREILDERGNESQVREELSLHPFVASKITSQARRFSMKQLEDVYRRLLKIDLDIKTGGMPGDVAFELLVTELTE